MRRTKPGCSVGGQVSPGPVLAWGAVVVAGLVIGALPLLLGLAVTGRWCGEVWNRRKSGEMYAALLNVSTVQDGQGNTLQYVALFSDITAIKDHQSHLEHLAHFDALTNLPNRLRQLGTLGKLAVVAEVPAESAGLVFIDGKLVQVLEAGSHAFWNFRKNVAVDVIELRVQSLEVSGQELLTRDKVSLRVNLAASIRITDPVAARTKVAKYGDYVYRELQFGLRKAIAAKTLDELLGDKASLDADIFGYVRGRVGELGIEVLGVGVKDVILPGEMKDILNGVVQAEKLAQANVIRRREEANATRSLLNTARLIEESPVLMRLKELEALEKVTEKIGNLTVFGGLDGVMKQLVSLK